MKENKIIEQNIQPQWNAVYSIALSIAGLIIAKQNAEFLRICL